MVEHPVFVITGPGSEGTERLVVELQEHVHTVTAPRKSPCEVEVVADVPKTIGGKIRRAELRRMERQRTRTAERDVQGRGPEHGDDGGPASEGGTRRGNAVDS